MTCLNQLETIFKNKDGFTELIQQLEQKDFSRIEATDDEFMKKFLEREEINKIDKKQTLEINDEEDIKKIINGKIDVSYIKKVIFNTELNKFCNSECIGNLFKKFNNIKHLDFGETNLSNIVGIENELYALFNNYNLKYISFGQTQLNKITGIEKHLPALFKNPNLKIINFGQTQLNKIPGIENILPILFQNPNITSINFGYTQLDKIPGIENILPILFTNTKLEYLDMGLTKADIVPGIHKIFYILLKKSNLFYLSLGTYTNIKNFKSKLPENISSFITIPSIHPQDLEKVKEILSNKQN